MGQELSLAELARQVREPPEKLREWRSLRLIGRDDADAFTQEDVERARLVQLLLRRGIDLAAIVRANASEKCVARYVDVIFPGGVGRTYSLEDAAERLGFDLAALRRFWEAFGLTGQADLLYEDDVQALSGIKIALDAGFPEEALLQLVRVHVDTLDRAADAESRLFHFYVHERMKARGIVGPELAEAVRASSDRLMPLIEPMVLYFHRKGSGKALREDAVLHVQQQADPGSGADVPGQLEVAIAFVDLAGFTPLAEAMGDEMAVHVLERFGDMVRSAVARSGGRVVKQIGDAFMLVFSDARSAINFTTEIEDRTAQEPLFPAVRSSIHRGPVLYREGDYLGTSVNVAARLAAEARRHQILVTAAVKREAVDLPDVEFLALGKRQL